MRKMKRKKILVVILALYLLVMAKLTIFSNEILQVTLPQVQVTEIRSMYFEKIYYDQVVAKEAIQYGEKGSTFIWAIEEKQSPLGIRKYVKIIPVSIIAQNNEKKLCAIEGAISLQMKIVFSFDRELKEGQEVSVVKTEIIIGDRDQEK